MCTNMFVCVIYERIYQYVYYGEYRSWARIGAFYINSTVTPQHTLFLGNRNCKIIFFRYRNSAKYIFKIITISKKCKSKNFKSKSDQIIINNNLNILKAKKMLVI